MPSQCPHLGPVRSYLPVFCSCFKASLVYCPRTSALFLSSLPDFPESNHTQVDFSFLLEPCIMLYLPSSLFFFFFYHDDSNCFAQLFWTKTHHDCADGQFGSVPTSRFTCCAPILTDVSQQNNLILDRCSLDTFSPAMIHS